MHMELKQLFGHECVNLSKPLRLPQLQTCIVACCCKALEPTMALANCVVNYRIVGACIVSKDGKILGRGHNMRIQKGSATLHVSHGRLTIMDLRNNNG